MTEQLLPAATAPHAPVSYAEPMSPSAAHPTTTAMQHSCTVQLAVAHAIAAGDGFSDSEPHDENPLQVIAVGMGQ